MRRRILSTLLTAAFAALSFLGHGGLHALPGGHDCHDGHGLDERTPFGSTVGCCHHRGHAHDPVTDPNSDSPGQSPLPIEHDHDNCVICQWHAQGQVRAVDVVIPLGDDSGAQTVQSSSQVATSFRLTTLFTRGPPATA